MIKEFKDNGCRFMCKCIPGSVSVFDMDVDDGVEVVEFEGFDDVSIGKIIPECNNTCYWGRSRLHINPE